MSHINYGCDLILDEDGDLVANPNGDVLNTDHVQQNDSSSYSFDGEYNVRTALLNRIMTITGDYQFDPNFGSQILNMVSSTQTGLMQSLKEKVRDALLKDQRVAKVNYVRPTRTDNIINIDASVTLVGSDAAITLVFPNIYIE